MGLLGGRAGRQQEGARGGPEPASPVLSHSHQAGAEWGQHLLMPSALPPPEMQAYDGGDSEEPAGPASSTRQRAEAETCCTESLSLR